MTCESHGAWHYGGISPLFHIHTLSRNVHSQLLRWDDGNTFVEHSESLFTAVRQGSRAERYVCTEKGICRESEVQLRDLIINHLVLTSPIEKSQGFWFRSNAPRMVESLARPTTTSGRERAFRRQGSRGGCDFIRVILHDPRCIFWGS